MLSLKHIRKSFDREEVLRDVSLQVRHGEVVSILGPSGSGKTTLLRCLDFLERADGGELTLDDLHVDLAHAKRRDVLAMRRRTAFVFQNYNLFANKTARENVMEGLVTARGVSPDEARKKAEEALAWVGLLDKAGEYPSRLFGGQQQRIGIARAVVLDPEVIFLDEPTSALDPELVGEVLNVIREVARRGIAMIIVTHEMAFAREVSHHVVFMEGGRVIEEGPPEQIFSQPREERTRTFLKRYLTDSNMYYI